ncbi:MAG: hypothetical protein MUC96_07695 [Myxococcaceae bacterium]|jgi:hypothetical protein|nr:hypothetical protein [Myxococcaceae bacterium]
MRGAGWWVVVGVLGCGGVVPGPDAATSVPGDEADAGQLVADGGPAVDASVDAGADAGRAAGGGRADGGAARPDGGPTLCDLDAGVRVRLDPATIDGGFSACPAPGIDARAGDCHVYCACWFRNCAVQVAYGCVHSGWDTCMAACATFSADELSCRLYRVNNRPLERHCGEARPRNACP